jgi:hypothetical protein
MRFNNSLRSLKGTAEDFATSFVDGLLAGHSASEALNSSLKGLTKSAADATVKNLLSGNFAGAAVSATVGVGASAASKLFRSTDDAKTDQPKEKPAHDRDQFRQAA